MGYIAYTSYKNGDPYSLSHAYDSDKRGCGLPNQKDDVTGEVVDLTDFPFIYFATPWFN